MTYVPNDRWRMPDGQPMSCFEKVKVMRGNLLDVFQAAQDLLDDAVLMGTTEDQVKAELHRLVDALRTDFAGR